MFLFKAAKEKMGAAKPIICGRTVTGGDSEGFGQRLIHDGRHGFVEKNKICMLRGAKTNRHHKTQDSTWASEVATTF